MTPSLSRLSYVLLWIIYLLQRTKPVSSYYRRKNFNQSEIVIFE